MTTNSRRRVVWIVELDGKPLQAELSRRAAYCWRYRNNYYGRRCRVVAYRPVPTGLKPTTGHKVSSRERADVGQRP